MKMKHFGIIMALLSLLISVVTGCQPQFQPGTYVDDMDREIIIDKAPQRIVSHVPSITETLFALGLDEEIVGVSDYCNYPEEAGLKSKVGNYFDPSIERIVELEPDLVLTDGHSQNINQLDSLDIKYMVMQPKDIDEIFKDIELLGKVTGTEKAAEELVRDMQKDMASISDRVKDDPGVKVFYMFDATDLNNPWTAGPGSFADSLITMAGGDNIAAIAEGPWIQFSIEVIVDADPEIIILDTIMGTAVVDPAELEAHPAWRETSAVKQGRIGTVNGDLVNRTGPRIVQGLEELAKIIHPELFK